MNTLTCVYCGHEYPEGTPPHGAQILTEHIKVCEKHPMRQLEADKAKLRKALVCLVGVDGKDELEMMEMHILDMGGDPEDSRAALMGIKALRETLGHGNDGGER